MSTSVLSPENRAWHKPQNTRAFWGWAANQTMFWGNFQSLKLEIIGFNHELSIQAKETTTPRTFFQTRNRSLEFVPQLAKSYVTRLPIQSRTSGKQLMADGIYA